MKIIIKTFTIISIVVFCVMLSACSKDELPQDNNNDDPFGSMKTDGINAENEYGLVCTISIDDLILTDGDDFIINYTIENTSEIAIDAAAYITLELVYNKPNYLLEQYWGDYYSLLWWNRTSYGHERKAFELNAGSTFSQSVDFTDIGWIAMTSSATQPDYPNFNELFGTGHFKFQLHISVDDYNNPTTPAVNVFSNVVELTIE